MSEKSFFGKLKSLNWWQREAAKVEHQSGPTLEVLKTNVGTTYLGELAGMTDKKRRPSNDRSAIVSLDQNQGVAAVICDGAGIDPDASLMAHCMVEEFKNAAEFVTHDQTPDDRERSLLKAPMHAINRFNSSEGRYIPEEVNASTTLVGYVIFDRILTMIDAGDSELHVMSDDKAECLSAREHHSHKEDENQLLVAVSRQNRYFKGESKQKELKSGDMVISFSDGFTDYYFEKAVFDFTTVEDSLQDYDLHKIDKTYRRGELYQKRMLELKQTIQRYAQEGKNPVDELLKIARENAERFARRNKLGYHDDITLAITIID